MIDRCIYEVNIYSTCSSKKMVGSKCCYYHIWYRLSGLGYSDVNKDICSVISCQQSNVLKIGLCSQHFKLAATLFGPLDDSQMIVFHELLAVLHQNINKVVDVSLYC